ncbi:MAG: dienelactone hydrolase family protein [Burkholderiales bacterium]|nr:dienelactone hydrolase family protein [Burkholderiales bacterium]
MSTRALALTGILAAACVAPQAPQQPLVSMSIPMEVLKPDGAGPFPAVVMLHDCSGLSARSSGAPRRWAKELVGRGYVVAIPDSFSTRGFPAGVCVDASPNRLDVNPFNRVKDAYEALSYVRTLPYVKSDRVGVMGGSHGGTTTLASIAVLARDPSRVAERKQHGFAAAIALYPACAVGNPRWTVEYKPAAPLLILAGELDDWTPAIPCEQLVEAATRAGASATIKVYPDAHHSFDNANALRFVPSRINANAPGQRGATTAGNPQAWADSIREVDAFFARHLVPGR